MSAKQCHRLRSLQRERDYTKAMVAWLQHKPSTIHFIQRIKWRRKESRRGDYI